MCDSHNLRMGRRPGFAMHPGHFMMMGECCNDLESTETKVKRLEAQKSYLQDRIGHIDQRIADLQKPEEDEEV